MPIRLPVELGIEPLGGRPWLITACHIRVANASWPPACSTFCMDSKPLHGGGRQLTPMPLVRKRDR